MNFKHFLFCIQFLLVLVLCTAVIFYCFCFGVLGTSASASTLTCWILEHSESQKGRIFYERKELETVLNRINCVELLFFSVHFNFYLEKGETHYKHTISSFNISTLAFGIYTPLDLELNTRKPTISDTLEIKCCKCSY